MSLLQFASTLQATGNAPTKTANAEPGAAPQPTAFNPMDMLRAMQGVPPGGGQRQLGYGGEEGARQWEEGKEQREEEQRKKAKERKRKRKAKKEKRKAKKAAKMAELINDKGMPYQQATAMVEDVYGDSSDSDSSSSNGSGRGLR